jgi:hypothetical protein
MTINSFDRSACKLVAHDAEEALRAVAEKHGLVFSRKSGSFSATTLTVHGEFSVVSQDGTAQTPEVTAFRQFATMYGLSPEDLGKEFEVRGRTFELTGLGSGSKYPLLAKEVGTSKVFKFEAHTVAAKLHPKGP